jgi:two-component system sensor histidine kinase YesM
MKVSSTLRVKLSLFHLIVTATTITLIVVLISYVYKQRNQQEFEGLTMTTLNSLAVNIETYLDDLERLTISPYLDNDIIHALNLTADDFYDSADDYTKLLADRALKDLLPNYLTNTRTDIMGTILVAMDDSYYLTPNYSTRVRKEYPFKEQDWYQKSVEADGKAVFISPHYQEYLNGEKSSKVFSVARLIKDPNSHKPLAIIMANANFSVLKKIVTDVDLGVHAIKLIMDRDNNIIYTSEYIDNKLEDQLKDINGDIIIGESDSYSVITESIGKANWKIVMLLSNKELQNKINWMYKIGILLVFISVIITYIFFDMLIWTIVKPFKKIIKVMADVQKGDLSSRVDLNKHDEIGKLGEALDKMIENLDLLIQSEYLAKLNQRNAEYYALQAQMHPHFLYNTLNGFVALNRMGKRQTLEQAILSLTGMLRYTLDEKNWSTLEEEFLFVEKYCNLQQLRLQEKLQLYIYLDDRLKTAHVPKLLLQPIVENAILHGIAPADRICELEITCKLISDEEEQIMLIHVSDTGVGFDSDQFTEFGIGTKNTKERLELFFPRGKMIIESIENEGTDISMIIPIKEVEGL